MMTDAQMITLAVAIIAVFAGTLYNNGRITDLRDSLNRRIDDKFATLDVRFAAVDVKFAALSQNFDSKFELLSLQLKTMGDNIMRILRDHETRLQKLEHKEDAPQ